MSLPSKVRKAKGGDNSQTTGKTVKSTDSKQDASKQPDKSQPTAEQMRIAQIIETKTEDPLLKEKLKQVMDATQKSIDEAYTALHDCDNDLNRAVNLLLEGMESEWSTSSKKKKNRTSSDKVAKEKEPPQEVVPEDDSWDPSVNSKPTVGNKGAPPRGRGRGFRGGRGNSNFQTNEQSDRGRRGKVLNGPSRGRGNRGRMQTRGFGRGRGTFRRPIDTWDPQRPISATLNHDANSEDWDNEEYTGSLANSQIYTSSGTGPAPPALNNSVISGSNSTSPNEYDKKIPIQIDSNSVKSINNIAHKPSSEISSLSIQYKQYSSIPSMPEPSITPPMGVRSPPMGANLIMLPPRTDRPPLPTQEIRMQRPRPKIPPPSKIPATAVEMPPDSVENNIGLLDVQFGAMELNENSADSVQVSPPTPNHSPSPAPSDKLIPHQAVATSDSLLLNETSFSPVRNSGSNSLSQISELTAKVSDVASSLYQEPSYPPYSKTAQQSPSVYSSTYSSGQKAWLNISTGSEETTADDAPHEPEEWKLLTSTAPTISVPFNDFEGVDNEVAMRTVLSTGAQQLAVEEQHEQEEQEEEVITPPSRTEVNSTSSIIYSTSSSQSTYSSSTGGVYGGISSSYPQYQYNNYPSQQNQSLPILTNSSNSYQSALGNLQYGSNSQSVYGTSGLPTPSYTTPYQSYNSTVQHNHKQTLLSSSSTNSKEFETTQPSVNLSSISHSGSINPSQTLLSASQTTPTSKPTSMSSIGKSTVVANMPPGVPPLVGTQYIMGQGGIPYFQQPLYYEDMQLMPQQRLAPHISTGYYEMGYPTSTTREGVQYNMNDGRFARADNTSPVQASSITQQSGSQAHQQPMINPTAIPPAYAYFYGGSAAMIPGNFQYGAPTLYPMAAGGTTSGHGNTNSGVYGKGPNNFTGNYGGNYENNQGNSSGTAGDFKTSTSSGPKVQSTQSANPSSNSDLVNIYSKSLSKSYEKQNFHCATPPPFNLGSQNSGMGPGGGYPQHLFIPTMTPHHNTTTLMHQPIHQDGTNTMSGRSQGGTQQAKVVMTKANFSSSTYWTQN